MRISDWSSDVCSSDLSWGAPFAWAGFAPHYPGNQMRGGGFDLLGRRSAPCSPTTGGIVLPAKLICLLPLLACAAACSEDGLTQAGSAMETGDLAIRAELPGEAVRGAGGGDGNGAQGPGGPGRSVRADVQTEGSE